MHVPACSRGARGCPPPSLACLAFLLLRPSVPMLACTWSPPRPDHCLRLCTCARSLTVPEHLFIQGRTASLAVGGGSSEARARSSDGHEPRRTPRLAPHLASVAFPATFHAIHLRHSPPPRSVTLFEQFITDKNDPVWVAWKKHVAYLGPLFKDKCTVMDVVALDAMIHDHQIAFDNCRSRRPAGRSARSRRRRARSAP